MTIAVVIVSTIVSRETRAQREPERGQSEKIFLAAAKPERAEPVFRAPEPARPLTEFELGRVVEAKRGEKPVDGRVDERVDTPVTATPEPATMALVATGLASLAAAKRRRAKKLELVNN
jgi:hypothetical protein